MLVYFGVTPDAKPKICVTPNANLRRQSVEYRWVGCSGVGHVYFMYISCIFHVVCASFSALATRKLADAKAVFSGIWAKSFFLVLPLFKGGVGWGNLPSCSIAHSHLHKSILDCANYPVNIYLTHLFY